MRRATLRQQMADNLLVTLVSAIMLEPCKAVDEDIGDDRKTGVACT
jgi:hypothetical protein